MWAKIGQELLHRRWRNQHTLCNIKLRCATNSASRTLVAAASAGTGWVVLLHAGRSNALTNASLTHHCSNARNFMMLMVTVGWKRRPPLSDQSGGRRCRTAAVAEAEAVRVTQWRDVTCDMTCDMTCHSPVLMADFPPTHPLCHASTHPLSCNKWHTADDMRGVGWCGGAAASNKHCNSASRGSAAQLTGANGTAELDTEAPVDAHVASIVHPRDAARHGVVCGVGGEGCRWASLLYWGCWGDTSQYEKVWTQDSHV